MWYRKAAEQGHAAAQCSLGLMYVYGYGQGVVKDESEAVKWFRKAAENGNSVAKEQLQRMGY
jgi:TPR repeat protein